MVNQKMGCGVVGCGNAGLWHMKSILNIPEAQLVAVSDSVEERGKKTGEKYGVKWYTDFNNLIEDDNIDLVHVCTPSGTHGEVTIAAAKARKHVLVEKPMEITLEKIHKMITACREANVKLGAIFQNRFTDSVSRVKKAIDDGKFGKLVLGNMIGKCYRPQEYYDSADWRGTWKWDGGGTLMNQHVHGIDLLQYFMGPIESVFAYTETLVRNIEVEDTAVVSFRFKSGALGIIEGATSVYPGSSPRYEIHGDRGTVIMEGVDIIRWEFEGEEPLQGERKTKPVSEIEGEPEKPGIPGIIYKEGHKRQIKDMIEAIKEDREPKINGEEGRKAIETILGIYQSAKTGRRVKFPLKKTIVV